MAAAQLVIGGAIPLQAPRQPLYLTAQKGTTSNKSSGNSSGGGGGFLEWLLKNLDKESFSETDPILSPGNGAAPSKPVKKNAPSPPVEDDKKGGLLGGLFSKN